MMAEVVRARARAWNTQTFSGGANLGICSKTISFKFIK